MDGQKINLLIVDDVLFPIKTPVSTGSSISSQITGDPVAGPVKRVDNRTVRAMVVDNDEDCLKHVADMLDKLGYECTAAGSGAEALDKFMSRPFDIVLIELQMPRMDGTTLAATLKAAESRTKVIIMTNRSVYGSLPIVIDGACEAVDGLICKPFSKQTLNRILTT